MTEKRGEIFGVEPTEIHDLFSEETIRMVAPDTLPLVRPTIL
jgi:hypothetical protein